MRTGKSNQNEQYFRLNKIVNQILVRLKYRTNLQTEGKKHVE